MRAEVLSFLLDAGNVLLGAIIGLGGAWFVDWRKDRKREAAVKAAIRRELQETAHRFLVLVYTMTGRHDQFDRSVLEWMKPQLERYGGPNPKDGILAAVVGLLAQPDAELKKLAAHQAQTTPPQFTPREEPAYVAAIVASAHDLDPDYAIRVLDILAHIRMLNDQRENGVYYTRLTFEPGVTKENHEKAIWNVNQAELMMAQRARIIIDKIAALEKAYPE